MGQISEMWQCGIACEISIDCCSFGIGVRLQNNLDQNLSIRCQIDHSIFQFLGLGGAGTVRNFKSWYLALPNIVHI